MSEQFVLYRRTKMTTNGVEPIGSVEFFVTSAKGFEAVLHSNPNYLREEIARDPDRETLYQMVKLTKEDKDD